LKLELLREDEIVILHKELQHTREELEKYSHLFAKIKKEIDLLKDEVIL